MRPDAESLREFAALPPHNVEAEMCLLGSFMVDPKAFAALRPTVLKEHFFQPDHQIVFGVLCSMQDAGQRIDGVTVRAELDRRKQLGEVGGIKYLSDLLTSAPSAAHASDYARLMRETWLLRGTIEVANGMIRRAYSPAEKDHGPDIVDKAMTRLARLATSSTSGESFAPLDDIIIDVLDQMTSGGAPTVPTGFPSLDDSGGVGLGEMWLIGARPSMGKSTLVKQIAVRTAMAGNAVAFVSLEEGRFKIGRNILSAESKVANNRIRRSSDLKPQEWTRISQAVQKLNGIPLYVTESCRRLADIRAEVTVLKSRHNVKMLVIDYLQRVQADGRTDYERVSAASQGISDLLKELNVAGLIPVQLSRGLENRNDKRPQMSDIRDSGKIEQDADGIIFLHREDYYRVTDPSRENEPLDRIAELIFAKYRDGVRGETVQLTSDLEFQTFIDPREDPF